MPGSPPTAGRMARARPVFRTLMSSKCEWNCAYCPLRAGSDLPRAALTPEELAKVFLPRFEKGVVQGLFLSTGVDGGAHAATEPDAGWRRASCASTTAIPATST